MIELKADPATLEDAETKINVMISSIWQGQVDLQRISSKGNRSNTGNLQITVKPVHVVTSIKQSLVLKGHLFLSCHKQFDMN